MNVLFVVDRAEDWALAIPGVDVISGRSYVEDRSFSRVRRALVFNLCRSYTYQRIGYYVSLLAEARGHRAWPSIATIQDLRSQMLTRVVGDELDLEIQRALRAVRTDRFDLSIYFGRPLVARHAALARALSTQFDAPLLRASFVRVDGEFELRSVRPIPLKEVPVSHRPFVVEAAQAWFQRRPRGRRPARGWYCHLAILCDPNEEMPPSDARAIKRFERAARKLDVRCEILGPDDIGKLPAYDALFIRATTQVGNFAHRFAQRAESEGLAVIDDPQSIVRCTNKAYLAELLDRHDVPAPKTMIVHRANRDSVTALLGLPCVLKQPDGAFSVGVVKAATSGELESGLDRMFASSELVVAQEFVPTDFDWRVGVLDRQLLWVCRYFMAPRHWQIIKRSDSGKASSGRVESIPIDDAPRAVTRIALRAAGLIGDGLYGVDLKQHGRKVRVVEVNDNPNIDAGIEDAILGEGLYERIVASLLARVERKREGGGR